MSLTNLESKFDDKLNWSRNIEKLYKKLSSALFSVKQIKFLNTSSLVTTYRSLVESRLRYCLGKLWLPSH